LSAAGNYSDICSAVNSGVSVIQYRVKNVSTRAMAEEASALKGLCGRALFIVNDRVDVALAVDADGVHIGRDDMPFGLARRLIGPDKIIGVSVHDISEAVTAEKAGADYIGVGPVYSTANKQDADEPTGIGLIREIRESVSIPVVAIGGIGLANARTVIDTGVDAICAISAVVCAADPGSVIREFQKMFFVR
jgi:thiamine-phosphate pyrophosphorylase